MVATAVQLSATREQLLGSWRLISWEILGHSDEVGYPLGQDPAGQLSYDKDGRMSAQLMRRGQPRFASENWRHATTEERARAWSGYFGYFGTYTIDDDARAVIHHVEGSWFPNLVGADETRYFRFEKNRLVLDAETAWGRVKIVWEKL